MTQHIYSYILNSSRPSISQRGTIFTYISAITLYHNCIRLTTIIIYIIVHSSSSSSSYYYYMYYYLLLFLWEDRIQIQSNYSIIIFTVFLASTSWMKTNFLSEHLLSVFGVTQRNRVGYLLSSIIYLYFQMSIHPHFGNAA